MRTVLVTRQPLPHGPAVRYARYGEALARLQAEVQARQA